MSHFTVLVTNTAEDKLEDQLEPFDENRRMPLHIVKTKADFIEKGREDVEYAKKKIAEYDDDPVKYESECVNVSHLEWLNGEAREVATITDNEELFKLGSQYYEDELDENGNYWSTSNDDAKWDWYEVGGRWAGFFRSKPGVVGEQGVHTAKRWAEATKAFGFPSEEVEDLPESACDVIKVKDIDWEAMDRAEKERRAKFYDEQMQKPEKERFIWSDDRDADLKATRDEYINRPIYHCTYAVLHEGRWYERGEMGWWGMASNEKDEDVWEKEFRKLIESLDPETEVTVVDCHI